MLSLLPKASLPVGALALLAEREPLEGRAGTDVFLSLDGAHCLVWRGLTNFRQCEAGGGDSLSGCSEALQAAAIREEIALGGVSAEALPLGWRLNQASESAMRTGPFLVARCLPVAPGDPGAQQMVVHPDDRGPGSGRT